MSRQREFSSPAINVSCHCWWCGRLIWPWRVRCVNCEEIAANRRALAFRLMAWLVDMRCFDPEPWHNADKLLYDSRGQWEL